MAIYPELDRLLLGEFGPSDDFDGVRTKQAF